MTRKGQEVPEDETSDVLPRAEDGESIQIHKAKASNLRMTLDACTNEGEKPLFGLTKKGVRIQDNALSSMEG